MRYTSGLCPPQVPSPHSESEGGSAELHCHDSLAHPSVRDPFCLSGPAMTGHTALDVFLHTRQTLGYGAAMTGDMTRQVRTSILPQSVLPISVLSLSVLPTLDIMQDACRY